MGSLFHHRFGECNRPHEERPSDPKIGERLKTSREAFLRGEGGELYRKTALVTFGHRLLEISKGVQDPREGARRLSQEIVAEFSRAHDTVKTGDDRRYFERELEEIELSVYECLKHLDAPLTAEESYRDRCRRVAQELLDLQNPETLDTIREVSHAPEAEASELLDVPPLDDEVKGEE